MTEPVQTPVPRKRVIGLMLIVFVTIWLTFCALITSIMLFSNMRYSMIYVFSALYGLFATYIGAITARMIWQQKPSAPRMFQLFGAATGIFFVSLPVTHMAPSSAAVWGPIGFGLIVFALFIIFGARYIKKVTSD